jgi:hypothetical protein
LKARHILLLWAIAYALIIAAAVVILSNGCATVPPCTPCDPGCYVVADTLGAT